MNPGLQRLHPYPSERMRSLFSGVLAPAGMDAINLSIGEPRHEPPQAALLALHACTERAVMTYPATSGTAPLREAIATWLRRRFALAGIEADRHVLPTLGSREALFAIAQVVLDARETGARVVMPNPGYQIYEGAALLAGAEPLYVPSSRPADWNIPVDTWRNVRLVYVCTPGNPDGGVLSLDDWRELLALRERHGFVIVSDECYCEIYPDEKCPPLGALQAAEMLGIADYRGVIAMGSLSKRSSVPGLRSGYAAGDEKLMRAFWLYRTYHGSAMSPVVEAVSIAAWSDELHVVDSRARYRANFQSFFSACPPAWTSAQPNGSFYVWVDVGTDDAAFARDLYASTGVLVLPGNFIGRAVDGHNPGSGRIRIALVDSAEVLADAARRIASHVVQQAI